MSGYQPENIGFETEDQQRWRNYLNGVDSTDKVINVKSWKYIIEEVDDMAVQVLSAYPQLVYVSAEDFDRWVRPEEMVSGAESAS